jgi:hypothetical protein
MLMSELDRLQVIHSEFNNIFEDQCTLAEGLEPLLEELDINKVQDIIE